MALQRMTSSKLGKRRHCGQAPLNFSLETPEIYLSSLEGTKLIVRLKLRYDVHPDHTS